MEINDFTRQLERTLEGAAAGSLSPQTRFRELPGWSSLAALDLIVLADSDYGVELSAEDLKKSQTIQDLFNILSSKRNE